MADHRSELLIIGAGPCGLGVAKALKEAGIRYSHFEADDNVGGNWYHGVYETAHIISSRKTTEYADFPMPSDYPDFPSQKQMADYYSLYADTFGLRERIEFGQKAIMCLPLEDGSWQVETASGEKRDYKGLIICNGHHWDKRMPEYPGQFSGELIHSKDYKRPEQLAGKRVLVIGGGNSACDIASEAARVAGEAHLSLRRGYWFLPKTLFGRPSAESPAILLPVFMQRAVLKLMLRIVVGRYEDYGLPKPDHKLFEHHPTVSSEILHYLKHGRIKPHSDIDRYDGKTIYFRDGTAADIDMIVAATGYFVSFPFLPEGLIEVKNGNIAQLYGGMFHPERKNLYIFGTQQVRYGVGPLITPAAKLLAKMVKMQDEMELPIGMVLKESGSALPATHLIDPIASLRGMKIANLTLPLLLRKEKKLRKRIKEKLLSETNIHFDPKPDIRVY